MAADETASDDGWVELTGPESDTDDDAEWIELDQGEEVVGELRNIKPNCGDYDTTVLRISRGPGDEVLMWSNRQIDNRLEENDVGTGDVVRIVHTEETSTYTPEDADEPVEFDVYKTFVRAGGNA